jgi:hypothetical protein
MRPHPFRADPRWSHECRSYSDAILTLCDEHERQGEGVAVKPR